MILRRVISGLQTGSDQGGVRAAKAAGLETGGTMPRGYLTEDGPRPDFAELYGAVEHESREYPPRTRKNAADSDATIWFGSGDSRGFGCTMNACRAANKPVFLVKTRSITPQQAADWLVANRVAVLNVAGNRESTSPGIGERTEAFMAEVIRILRGGGPNGR
jgi:hypothetical protein